MLVFDKPKYIKWLEPKKIIIDKTHKIFCYELKYDLNNNEVLDDWAKHIRRHYMSDDELEYFSKLSEMTYSDYLSSYIIPREGSELGSTTISGEFAEIITYDIREYIFGELSFRGRHNCKSTPEQGVTGSDIITCKMVKTDSADENDVLFITESKAILSKTDYSVLTKSYDDSKKDSFRYSKSLNYLARLYRNNGENDMVLKVERFLMKSKKSHRESFEGSGTTSLKSFDKNDLLDCYDEDTRFERAIFVYGDDLLGLAKELYRRACCV